MCKCNRPLCNECQGFEKAHQPVRHKHADVIKAWADGAQVQWKKGPVWEDTPQPAWSNDWEYRVKPTPIPLWQVARDAWQCDDFMRMITEKRWQSVADAVIKAYKEQQ